MACYNFVTGTGSSGEYAFLSTCRDLEQESLVRRTSYANDIFDEWATMATEVRKTPTTLLVGF